MGDEYARLRGGAQSLPELSKSVGYNRFQGGPPSSKVDSFRDMLAETMAELSVAAEPPGKNAPKAGRRKPAARKRYVQEDGLVNTYDRERTPGGNPQPKIKGWESWQLTQVNDRGEEVCAASSFDPPWRAPEDKEGATISPDPGYHHSAVRGMTIDEMRKERAQRQLLIASGQQPVAILADVSPEKGTAGQRREFFRMDFTNKPFNQLQYNTKAEMADPARTAKRQLQAERAARKAAALAASQRTARPQVAARASGSAVCAHCDGGARCGRHQLFPIREQTGERFLAASGPNFECQPALRAVSR
jgi:hypothetical protein